MKLITFVKREEPEIVKNTLYHEANSIQNMKAKDIYFNLGIGVIESGDSYLSPSKMREGYGKIKAYQWSLKDLEIQPIQSVELLPCTSLDAAFDLDNRLRTEKLAFSWDILCIDPE